MGAASRSDFIVDTRAKITYTLALKKALLSAHPTDVSYGPGLDGKAEGVESGVEVSSQA